MSAQHGRVWITLTAERLELLQRGKVIKVTQNGTKFGVRPILGCCIGMRMLIRKDAKLARTFKACPYCKKELVTNGDGNPVYFRKSNTLKGARRVKDPVTGKLQWVKAVPNANEQGQ
jgi:hypothetical protein